MARSPIYRLYIDETGNADLEASKDPNHRYLSLTGVAVRLDTVKDSLIPNLESIKDDIFHQDPDEPLILHRKELVNKNYPFNALRDPRAEAEFNRRLLTLMSDMSYRVISVVIDKLDHLTRYRLWRYDPYHYCLEALLERYVLLLQGLHTVGDVMGEIRGGKADKRLEASYKRLWAKGGAYIGPETFQFRLTSNHLKLKAKSKNIAGLQFADLIAHPSAAYIRSQHNAGPAPANFAQQISELLVQRKYHRRGARIRGIGTKWLP